MAASTAPKADDWDLDRLRLPPELVGDPTPRKRAPRHRAGESFLRGPIPFAWVAAACRLPGAGLRVAMAVRFLRGRFSRRRSWGLADLASGLGLSEKTARRGIHAAELAGLVAVEREPGCKLTLAILDVPEPSEGPGRRPPLYGPIPWRWWHRASRLPGPALHVATACWLVAGWERSGSFEFGLAGWSDLGLSRYAAGRGLRELERTGLVEAVGDIGRKSVVTIREAPPPSRIGPTDRGPFPRPLESPGWPDGRLGPTEVAGGLGGAVYPEDPPETSTRGLHRSEGRTLGIAPVADLPRSGASEGA